MFLKLIFLFAVLVFVKGALDDPCTNNWNCNSLVDAECSNGRCQCIADAVRHEDSCILDSSPQISCTTNFDCKSPQDERRICVDNKCRCIPYHHPVGNNCVRNRGLKEMCSQDEDCYWGKDMVGIMQCSNLACSCKAGYIPYNGRKCKSAASINVPSTTFAVLLVSLFVFKFLY